MSRFFKSLGLLAGSTLLSLLLVEGVVRVVVDDGLQFDLEMWKYAKLIKRISAVEGVGHEHQPGTSALLMGVDVSINSVKLRDRELAIPKLAGTLRVIMLGDSLTFGWGVPQGETVSKRLEAMLNAGADGRRYEVINAGVGNYNTSMSVNWMTREGMAFQPDLVVLNYFINDAELTPRRKGGGLREWSYAFVFIAGQLDRHWRTLRGAGWLEYYRGLYDPDAAGWPIARQSFRRLAAFCRERGVPLVLVHYPVLHQFEPYPFQDITGQIRALADEEGVPFHDLYPGVRDEDPAGLWLNPADPHPNSYADDLFAASIHRFLQDATLPGPADDGHE